MRTRLAFDTAPPAALALRGIALFGILAHFALAAPALADAALFFAAILCAFAAAFMLGIKKIKTHEAVISFLLAPFAARFLIMLPRVFSGGNLTTSIVLDSLLLTYDRNNFVSCLPFYYASITTFCAVVRRRALRVCTLLDCAVLITAFSFVRSNDIYRLPIVLLGAAGVLLLLELTALMLAIHRDYMLKKSEAVSGAALLLLLMCAGGALLFYEIERGGLGNRSGGEAQSGEAAAGMGLLRPGLFNFDMTPYLNLHTEVSMKNELVFIVRKDKRDDRHILMRRFILSAYNSESAENAAAGFTRSETIDEDNQRAEVPAGSLDIAAPAYKKRVPLKQEYYIKNIDGGALLAMNEPASITPFENYDASSFKSVYGVESFVSEAEPLDLFIAAQKHQNDDSFGLNAKDFMWYTRFATAANGPTQTETRMRQLAKELTLDCPDAYTKTITLLNYFTKGEFRYSLKPGIAPDGDQLAHFLFTTKRGYCSYFALAFASMLRSLHIPSRVAVGFFLDPETERFGFYPVRSSNAHAWVEVYFPEYGWIELDPTTESIAEDELQPEFGETPIDSFEQLMKEILENRAKLKEKEKIEDKNDNALTRITRQVVQTARSFALPLCGITLFITLLALRFRLYLLSRFARNPRRKTLLLWRHIRLRLRLKGYTHTVLSSEGEWLLSLPHTELFTSLYNDVSRARYANDYTSDDAALFTARYAEVCAVLRKLVRYRARHTCVIIACAFLALHTTARAEEIFADANALYDAALNAMYNEYWERSIALFNQGKNIYPDDWRFAAGLGDLYFAEQLYQLAREEYTFVLNILPDYPDALYKRAETCGSLNDYDGAALDYERYLELYPGDFSVIASLGWVYFKLHRLQEGEALLTQAITEYGARPHLSMTLAMIYADMMNYSEGARCYAEALSTSHDFAANSFDSQYFSATTWYNFAILESRFYNYKTSFICAENSLKSFDRDIGHMMCGELYLRRLDWARSFDEYEKAFEMDKRSPLPKLSLAQNYLLAGRLDEARLYAEDCLKARNGAWMFRFGIDPAQYECDLYEIIYQIYEGLYHKEQFTVYANIRAWLQGVQNKINFQFKHRMYKYLYEKNALATAHSYKRAEMGGQYIDALTQYYRAFERYPRSAALYLRLARDYETELIPASMSNYRYQEGKLTANTALIAEALAGFDAVWERDVSAEALAALALSAKKRGRADEARDAAARLYRVNSGALVQHGIRLPVTLTIEGGSAYERRTLRSQILHAGFSSDKRAVFALSLVIDNAAVRFSLTQKNSAAVIARAALPRADAANALRTAVFSVHP